MCIYDFMNNWTICQRLIWFQLLAKSLFGEEIASLLIGTLSTEYGIESSLIMAAMRDCASCNNVA